MKAVGYRASLPITKAEALIDFDAPVLDPGPRDLRVSVRAVSVNPVDTKLRSGMAPPSGETRILGFDAAGVVESTGSMVTLFKPGDEVFYAGAIDRPGSNGELHLVDERIVGRKPSSLSFPQAAAMPLTAITAWELLFDRLGVPYGRKEKQGELLVIGGAGGVGSILTQLARRLTGLRVIATASRPETIAWCREMGAHDVIDHRRPLDEALGEIGLSNIPFIAALTGTEKHLPVLPKVIAPQGKLAVIDDPKVLDVMPFKRKCASVHWEYMFARPVFQTRDMIAQHLLLSEVSELVDAGVLRTTMTGNAGPIRAANLRSVHAAVESGRAIGKTVLSGF
ncbi:MAG: zinc-binding alcohol dehydrogenase family protein [Acetobacteraceae bacterium]|nr:zinc-binding alcohol dehydrogenase family protein [Acetobacteraceae bacterium]